MKWLFGFAIAMAMLTPTHVALAQQSGKVRSDQRSGQQADRDAKERTQGKKGGGQGGGGLFRLLDVDRDGKLSAKEIDGAVAVLMKLDRDRNGVLSSEELASVRRGRRGSGRRSKGGIRDDPRKETRVRDDQ